MYRVFCETYSKLQNDILHIIFSENVTSLYVQLTTDLFFMLFDRASYYRLISITNLVHNSFIL